LLTEEADTLTELTGSAPLSHTQAVLAAWRGDEARAVQMIEGTIRDGTARGEGPALTSAAFAVAVLNNGLGRYEAALAAAQEAITRYDMNQFNWIVVEVIEAAVRTGDTGTATAALEQLAERTRAIGTDWALGMEARSRALLTDGQTAERLYREAIVRLDRTGIAVHRARAYLIFGEWLRRERRPTDAREMLRTAYDMFAAMGAEGFAERAVRELRATGEHVRARTVETRAQLTGQEEQIAELASVGSTNSEIGAKLFISPRTVEYHLHKVFTKLGITSRNQLGEVLGAGRSKLGQSSNR